VTPVGPACATGAAEELAHTAGVVAQRIYAGELASSETGADKREVEEYEPLLNAMASGERGAIEAAVHHLVYSGTHIVRLRVMKGSTVLADIGGPYILAPVTGTLRQHGRTVGHYILSVQDDLGYVKLETRFIAAPLVMRIGSHHIPIEGQLSPGPANIPDHGRVTYRHVIYQAYSFNARSFPGGPLRISLLMPLPAGLSKESCVQIRSSELGHVAQLIADRFALAPSNLAAYITFTGGLTGGLLYIREGALQLAGVSRPGPAHLPDSGTVKYRGLTYEVYSFTVSSTVGQVRIYQLAVP
jgi:hypothetical protein